MDRKKDLRDRGERAVLVTRSGVDVEEVANNYVKVETMDSSIEDYCDIYSSDLKKRLQLESDYLPDSLALDSCHDSVRRMNRTLFVTLTLSLIVSGYFQPNFF